ncbi:MAG: hypothetical protein EKK41_22495 [Hyphomicrobiales bacterium]|nr:MAG: hypothetical protein EKK41_22495 [Hyphomicrobiales bacterium]
MSAAKPDSHIDRRTSPMMFEQDGLPLPISIEVRKVSSTSLIGMLALATALAGSCVTEGAIAQTAPPEQVCFDSDSATQPTKVTFERGHVLVVTERTTDLLRHEMQMPDGARITSVSYRGLFTLAMDQPKAKIELEWKQDLAQLMPLAVGKQIVAEAVYVSPPGIAGYVTEMNVVGLERIQIGKCEYPVFKIEVVGRLKDGAPQAKSTRYYHAPSMLTLRTVTTTPAIAGRPAREVDDRAVNIE